MLKSLATLFLFSVVLITLTDSFVTPSPVNIHNDGSSRLRKTTRNIASTHPQPFVDRRRRTHALRAMNLGKALKMGIMGKLAGEYNEAEVKGKLDGWIDESSDGVVMLSFESCPYCVKAREILNDLNVEFKDIKINDLPDNNAIRCELGKAYDQTSVPAIFLNKEFLGGCNNGGKGGLVPLIESGEFAKMIAK